MTDFVSLFTGMSERDIGYLLKNMVQRSINEELTNSEISSIDNKTPVLLTNSKDIELMNDIAIQSTINIETPTQYLMPEEPDGNNLKVWLKFQNAGQLRDWSYQKVKSYSVGSTTMPGLFYRTEENNMLKSELYSYFDGHNHYAYGVDAAPIRILPNITASKVTSFFMRLVPISLSRLLASENNSLFTKVDDDQLRYGYSVTIDLNGSIHFYVKNNYRQYHLFASNAYNSLLTNPILSSSISPQPFRSENFLTSNFTTNYETLCSMVALEPPFDDWFFKYNPTTHNMSVLKTVENNPSAVFADTSLVTVAPYLSLPIQEGKYTHSGTVQTTVYDNSGNGNNGTINNIAVGGEWQDDNTLKNKGGNGSGGAIDITLPSMAPINTATEFTIAFWFNPLDTPINPNNHHEYLVWREASMAGDFWLERKPLSGTLDFTLRDTAGNFRLARFTNAIVNEDTWHFIVCKWKSGEVVKMSVNNSANVVSSSTAIITTPNHTEPPRLFYQLRSPKGKIALFKFYITQISSTVQDDLYYEGYHNPLFPKSENIQPVVSETPDPIFIPFSNVYTLDKMSSPVAGDYRRINSLSGDNPLVQKYNVADGTSTVDPVVVQYNIADGVNTGGGFVAYNEIYTCTDPSNNSSSECSLANDNIATVVEIQTGSLLIGKKITKAIFFLRGDNTPTGTVRCRVWNAAGTVVQNLWLDGTLNANLNAASVNTSTHTAYTFINTDLTPWGANSLAVGWKIGIEYDNTGGTSNDAIMVKRNRANPRANEWNNNKDYGGTWDTSPDDDDLVGNLFEGGTGSATIEPWYVIDNTNQFVGEVVGAGSTLANKIPTKIELNVKRNASATSGTFYVYHTTSGGVSTLLTSFPVTNFTTTATLTIVFNNINNTKVFAANERYTFGCQGTLPAGGTVSVMTNRGNTGGSNNYQGTTSYLSKRNSAGTWTFDTTLDITGKITTGGNNFDAFVRLSATRTRVATKSVNSSSSLHNQKITQTKARIKKVGSPGGIINCFIRTPTDAVKVTFSSVDVSTITADGAYHDVIFENFTHTYLMNSTTGSGDKIVYEFAGSDASNYIEFNANHDVFDTSTLSTITQTYDSGSYVDDSQRDLAGNMYSGGEPDLTSRTRVAQSIEHQDSRLKGAKITRVKAFLYRTTTGVSGTVYCNIRRGTDDSLVKTLGTVAASTLSTTAGTPTEPLFEDTTNNYPLTVGDKVTIEFSGGNTTDQVGVLVREVVPNYDLSNSYIRKYDEVDYDDEETTKDLCAVMDQGGFFFTPDPGSIPDPTPVNDKDLIICAGNNKLSGFFETFLMEFRIYSKDITTDNADNLYSNRYSISPIANNQILMPFSLKMDTTDAV